jgi:NADH dehydrogenase (ubiquinone) 1 alpha/beta subcomplex 1
LSAISDRLQEIIEEFGVMTEKTIFTPTSNLRKDIGLDSLDSVELVMAVEEEWDIGLPDKEVETWETAQDVINSIEKRVHNARPNCM